MIRPFGSAAYRIAFTYSAAFALAIVALGAIVYIAADADFRRQQDSGRSPRTRDLGASYREEGLTDLAEAIARARSNRARPTALAMRCSIAPGAGSSAR